MNIYYYYPLTLHYQSGQTLQVIQDYKALTTHGYRVFLYGTYEDEAAFELLKKDIEHSPIHISYRHGNSKWNRNILKWKMLWEMLRDPRPKIVVSRNINKMSEALAFKPLLRRCQFFWERHEDAIPYMLKQGPHPKEKRQMTRILQKLDALVLTNYSQKTLFEQEFKTLPPHIILPNGVDLDIFSGAAAPQYKENYVLTYTGQFTRWKNVELLFQSVALLDERFHLRLAGGKGDGASKQWVNSLAQKYSISHRVEYLGFVSPKLVPSHVLSGSSALLLPLGNNLESRYFTSPMKLVEYMATSIPVIAVDYPSVRGIAGKNSVYLSEASPQTFANTIKLALQDPQQPQRIATMNALAAQFTHKIRAQQYHQFICRVP